MRLGEVVGRRLVTTTGAEEIGRVTTAIIDPSEHRVVGFRLNDELLVPLDAVEAIGDEAVMVTGRDAVRLPTSDVEQRWMHERLDVADRPVLSDEGDRLSPVDDVEFDPSDGAIESLVLEDRHVAADQLVGVGRYAVVVVERSDTSG